MQQAAKPLEVRPIRTICLDIDKDTKLTFLERYFFSLGCELLLEGNRLTVTLPPGSIEEVYPGMSTPLRQDTTIRLPHGACFHKVILYNGELSWTGVAVPGGIRRYVQRGERSLL